MRARAFRKPRVPPLLFTVVLLTAACSAQKKEEPAPAAPASEAAKEEAVLESTPYDVLPESVRLAVDKPFTGDFDEMIKRRSIRVAVTFNRTHYFIDKGRERGLTYESLKIFEDD